MKSIACTIMFGIVWNTPSHIWVGFTDVSKTFVVVFGFLMWCGALGFLCGEKS